MHTENFTTINDFIRYGLTKANQAKLYYGHGTDNALDDLRYLILGSLALPYDLTGALLNAKLTDQEKIHLTEQLIKRIEQRIPVAYLVQEALFCGLSFYVDERVLIPRSPVAELIQQQFEPWLEADKVHAILDLCTGSGCIAIACAKAFPDAEVDAVDLSKDALAVAEINRQKHQVADTLTLYHSDCLNSLPNKRYDLIISNPPYVSSVDMQTLPPEYLHEPKMALETSNEGLAIVDSILARAHEFLTEEGVLIVEVGLSEEALANAYPELPFLWLDFEHGGEGVFLLTALQLKAYHGLTQ